jgi:hypothetical protein
VKAELLKKAQKEKRDFKEVAEEYHRGIRDVARSDNAARVKVVKSEEGTVLVDPSKPEPTPEFALQSITQDSRPSDSFYLKEKLTRSSSEQDIPVTVFSSVSYRLMREHNVAPKADTIPILKRMAGEDVEAFVNIYGWEMTQILISL